MSKHPKIIALRKQADALEKLDYGNKSIADAMREVADIVEDILDRAVPAPRQDKETE